LRQVLVGNARYVNHRNTKNTEVAQRNATGPI
jgi:hypothetical protein